MSDDTTLDVSSSKDSPEPLPSPDEIRDLAEDLRRFLKAWSGVHLTSFPRGLVNKADFEAMLLMTFRQALGDQQFHTPRHPERFIPGVVPTGVDAKQYSGTILEDPSPAPGEDDAYTMWLLHSFCEKCRAALQDQPEFQFVWRKLDRVLDAKIFQPESATAEESPTVSILDDFENDDEVPEHIRRRIQESEDESDFAGETESSVFFNFDPRPIDVTLLDELVVAATEYSHAPSSNLRLPESGVNPASSGDASTENNRDSPDTSQDGTGSTGWNGVDPNPHATPRPNGPSNDENGLAFWWNNEPLCNPYWRIVAHMWTREEDTESNVVLAVWREQVSDSTLRSNINRASQGLKKIGHGKQLYLKSGYVRWKNVN